MSVKEGWITVMPMLLVLTLREASLVPVERATLEMASLAQVFFPMRNPRACIICIFDCFPDFNECGLNLHNCDANAFCTDIIGGFTCTCEQGYTGNGITCISTTLLFKHA